MKTSIRIFNNNELSIIEKNEILKFTCKCFGDDELSQKSKTIYFSPTLYHLLLYIDNKLISYLRIIKRETIYRDKKIIIGGIGGVSTLENYRKKGYATKLLKKAMNILKKENFDIGLLQTNPYKGAKLYGKVGFVLINKAYIFRDIFGKKIKTESRGVMLAPIKSNAIFREIIDSKEVLNVGDGDW